MTGAIAAVNLTTIPQSLTVKLQDGQTRTLPCATEMLSVWRAGRMSRLSDLTVGDRVTIRLEADKNGMSVVKSIQVKAAPEAASAAPSSPATKAN